MEESIKIEEKYKLSLTKNINIIFHLKKKKKKKKKKKSI